MEGDIVRCTIEMELIEGRDFQVPEIGKVTTEQAAAIMFAIIIKNEKFNFYDYIQTKIVEEKS